MGKPTKPQTRGKAYSINANSSQNAKTNENWSLNS